MLNEKAPYSLYYQLKELLVKKIKNNEWTVNTKIPTERELCELYNVSRITVRQALNEMEKEGYVYRKQGRGTFVTVPKLEQRLSNFYSFSNEIRKMGAEPSTEVLEFNIIKSSETIAKNLGIITGEEVYLIKRLRLADHEPFTVETSYIPCSMAEGLEKYKIEKGSLYSVLNSDFGITPDEAVETFEAVLIPQDYAEHLRVKKNSAGLKLKRITKAEGTIIEYCESIIRGDRYRYTVYLKQ